MVKASNRFLIVFNWEVLASMLYIFGAKGLCLSKDGERKLRDSGALPSSTVAYIAFQIVPRAEAHLSHSGYDEGPGRVEWFVKI